MPLLPRFSLIPQLIPDALGIAAVIIAVHISLAKMFAKKLLYKIDSRQVKHNKNYSYFRSFML